MLAVLNFQQSLIPATSGIDISFKVQVGISLNKNTPLSTKHKFGGLSSSYFSPNQYQTARFELVEGKLEF